MASNGSIINALNRAVGQRCIVFADSGDSFSGVLSNVSDNTCTVVSTICGRCCMSQRVNTIPIDKISCLTTARE